MINFTIGMIVGCIVSSVTYLILSLMQTRFGTLVIDKSNPDKDSYNIVINDLDNIEKKRRVDLKISVINDSSQN